MSNYTSSHFYCCVVMSVTISASLKRWSIRVYSHLFCRGFMVFNIDCPTQCPYKMMFVSFKVTRRGPEGAQIAAYPSGAPIVTTGFFMFLSVFCCVCCCCFCFIPLWSLCCLIFSLLRSVFGTLSCLFGHFFSHCIVCSSSISSYTEIAFNTSICK